MVHNHISFSKDVIKSSGLKDIAKMMDILYKSGDMPRNFVLFSNHFNEERITFDLELLQMKSLSLN